jgi:hypothetical protein
MDCDRSSSAAACVRWVRRGIYRDNWSRTQSASDSERIRIPDRCPRGGQDRHQSAVIQCVRCIDSRRLSCEDPNVVSPTLNRPIAAHVQVATPRALVAMTSRTIRAQGRADVIAIRRSCEIADANSCRTMSPLGITGAGRECPGLLAARGSPGQDLLVCVVGSPLDQVQELSPEGSQLVVERGPGRERD